MADVLGDGGDLVVGDVQFFKHLQLQHLGGQRLDLVVPHPQHAQDFQVEDCLGDLKPFRNKYVTPDTLYYCSVFGDIDIGKTQSTSFRFQVLVYGFIPGGDNNQGGSKNTHKITTNAE